MNLTFLQGSSCYCALRLLLAPSTAYWLLPDTLDVPLSGNASLTYTCYSAPGRRDWIAKLSPEGDDTGPWADRGPWRGCRPGDVGMMRLERVR